jgi:hypothetical protein
LPASRVQEVKWLTPIRAGVLSGNLRGTTNSIIEETFSSSARFPAIDAIGLRPSIHPRLRSRFGVGRASVTRSGNPVSQRSAQYWAMADRRMGSRRLSSLLVGPREIASQSSQEHSVHLG